MKPHTKDWLALSAYDLDVARDLMESRRYVYAVFMCHLSTERLLRAAAVEFAGQDPPPRVQALSRLAEIAGLRPSEAHAKFLAELTLQQQGARYPTNLETLTRLFTAASAERVLRLTTDFRKWLEPKLKSRTQ